jgi:DNA-binding MarR family transcriptional regulator
LSNRQPDPDVTPPAAAAAGLRIRRHRVADVPDATEAQRTLMVVEVVDELTSWKAADRVKVFRSWLKGSLSLIHLHVLTVLEADGPMAMSRLADTLDVSVASATGIVTRMEERGLVERRHDQEDRRVVIVAPTEAGVSVFKDMMAARREHLTGVLARLSDEELESFLVGLRAVRAARAAVHSAAGTETPGETTPQTTTTEGDAG